MCWVILIKPAYPMTTSIAATGQLALLLQYSRKNRGLSQTKPGHNLGLPQVQH
jgi:hypothetical protein